MQNTFRLAGRAGCEGKINDAIRTRRWRRRWSFTIGQQYSRQLLELTNARARETIDRSQVLERTHPVGDVVMIRIGTVPFLHDKCRHAHLLQQCNDLRYSMVPVERGAADKALPRTGKHNNRRLNAARQPGGDALARRNPRRPRSSAKASAAAIRRA